MTQETTNAAPQLPLLEVSGLGVTAGGRPLFSGACFSVGAGEIALVVGPSGAGKTVLLKILGGLIRPGREGFSVEGEVLTRRASGEPGPGRVGIVFQDFALFDDLTMEENILFGLDHGGRRGVGGRKEARRWASELEVPLDVPVGQASLGQRQRSALARTLAFDADVILFDEPTSGLDPRQSRRVVNLIRRTAQEFGRAAVVVTHEHEYISDEADVLLRIDEAGQRIVPISPADLDEWAQSDAAGAPPPAPSAPSLGRRVLGRVGDFFQATTRTVEEILTLPWWLLPAWRSPRWGLKGFARYFRLVAFPSSLLYISIAGMIVGVVTTYFTFAYFPLKAYTEPIIIDDILSSLGYAQYRIIVPVLVAILVAARCGAAVAADVGNRVYSHQVDALRSFGLSPRRYLYTNILWAFVLGVPILTAAAFIVAQFASLVVFIYMHPDSSPVFWQYHFFDQIRADGFLFKGTGWVAAKMTFSALGIGAVAYHTGITEKPSAGSVNAAITSSVIRCTLLVLAVHAGFAFAEFAHLAVYSG